MSLISWIPRNEPIYGAIGSKAKKLCDSEKNDTKRYTNAPFWSVHGNLEGSFNGILWY